jgi:hypothetical protein
MFDLNIILLLLRAFFLFLRVVLEVVGGDLGMVLLTLHVLLELVVGLDLALHALEHLID